jgi:hypothetical protein
VRKEDENGRKMREREEKEACSEVRERENGEKE